MQSYRYKDNWSSVFDTIDDSPDPTLPRPDITNRPTLFTITCYVNYQYVPSERTEVINITDKGFYYNYIYKNEKKTFTFDYLTTWFSDVSEENDENSNYIQTALRLSKRDHVVDLIFLELESYYKVKSVIEKNTIMLDFEDKYIIKDRIGHGASANVFKIVNTNTNRRYAGKFISKEY